MIPYKRMLIIFIGSLMGVALLVGIIVCICQTITYQRKVRRQREIRQVHYDHTRGLVKLPV